jgi:zinc protease
VTGRRLFGVGSVVTLFCAGGCAVSPRPVLPSGSAGLSADDETLRAQAPPPEQAFRFRTPEPYAVTLSNGMQLVVLERHTLRLVAIDLVLRGGAAGLPHGSPAVAQLMSGAWLHGTQPFGEVQLLQALNQNAIQMVSHVADTWVGVKVRSGSTRLDAALRLLHDVALEPAFPPEVVDVARRRLLADEVARPDDPLLAARRNLLASLYGLSHPYTVTLAPLAHDLETASRDDVVGFWRTLMDPARATLVVAGDVNPLVVRQSVASVFGGWVRDPAARDPIPVAAPPAMSRSTRIIAVDRPGARQATIFYGGHLPDDTMAARASRSLLQGLVDQSQMRANASPGLDAAITWRPSWHFPAGILWWETQVAPAQAPIAVRELDGWLRQLREHGPDARDLEAARGRATHFYPVGLETLESIADTYADFAGADWPLDSIKQFQASVTTLSWEQIRAALPPADQMSLVVVGDLKVITPQLLSLGWGPFEVHDRDGRPVK